MNNRRTNNPKKKCGYKRCKWPRLSYKKYCAKHVDMFLEGTPLMKTFSQILAENKKVKTVDLGTYREKDYPSTEKMAEQIEKDAIAALSKPSLKHRIKRFIFK